MLTAVPCINLRSVILPECIYCLTTFLADFLRGESWSTIDFPRLRLIPDDRSLLETPASLIDHGPGALETKSSQGFEANIWKHTRP